MWGSLRGLKDQVENVSKSVSKPGGVSTFISRIGEAVAPTVMNSYDEEDDDNEYYEEDEEYYEEDEEDGAYDDEETMEYFVEEEESNIDNKISFDDNDEGEVLPNKSPPPEAFSNLIARAFDKLEEDENYTDDDNNNEYIITESLTANDDDGLAQEDAALEQISESIRNEIEITSSSNSDVVVPVPSDQGKTAASTTNGSFTKAAVVPLTSNLPEDEKDISIVASSIIYPEEDIDTNNSRTLKGNDAIVLDPNSNTSLKRENSANSVNKNGVISAAYNDELNEQPLGNDEGKITALQNISNTNSTKPQNKPTDHKEREEALCSTMLPRDGEIFSSEEEILSLGPVVNDTAKADSEAFSQEIVLHGTGQADDELEDSILIDEDQEVSDTSLDRPAILAQSINYIRQLEDNLSKEKSLSASLQSELSTLSNQFQLYKQQTDDRFRQHAQALKQYTEENKVLSKEKARLEAVSKERQSLYEEESQKQRMQYQRLLEESKRSINQGEQKLEEKIGEIQQLQKVISDMRSNMRATADRASEAEEIIKELTCERDELEKELHEELDMKAALEEELEEIKRASGKVGGLQMELKMLKEETDREKEKSLSAAEAARSNLTELASQRDAAKQEVRDLERQLAAALADLELSRKDYERAVMSNENLQSALESFQVEREAELSLLEEQRKHAEAALAAAHAAGIEAINEVNEARVKEVQMAADTAIRNLMEEIKILEASVEKHRKEAVNLRRSLDEAIHRLQATQEDVVDRSLMKNMLLDWHARKGHSKREVLEVMSSLLHFTDDDKIKVGLGDAGHGTFGKVVEVVAAPLPKSVVDADKIEGESVREKWVNFLLAETGDS